MLLLHYFLYLQQFLYVVLILKLFFYRQRMWKLIKFSVVGGIGFAIDFALTWFFKERIDLNPYLSNGIGFIAAVVNNFYINKFWTFSDKQGKISEQFGYFIFFSLIGLGLNTLFLFLIINYMGLNFYVSKCISILLVFIWNFCANNFVTFKETKQA